ncbi:MAG TPA: DNA starvation/stationary phase protection protein [Flavobacteriales bacterium]|nr:DNA starvation/stationary phase protection protein [Flavobacteriales bacterium]|tara:strand:- start:87776 stop:88252 length:477 start_codon:yes stop_codon:yes gene_type:complete
MKDKNAIGLDEGKSKELASKLSDLLANYSVFYQNTRGYHWNLKGEKFFELHVKFEELYNDLIIKIDAIAERIRTLGYKAEYRYTEYLKISDIKETDSVKDGFHSVKEILKALQIILSKQRVILELSEKINDEGTNSLMSDYIREQEKLVWMYSSFLNK